jgi:hypothetical protein
VRVCVRDLVSLMTITGTERQHTRLRARTTALRRREIGACVIASSVRMTHRHAQRNEVQVVQVPSKGDGKMLELALTEASTAQVRAAV